MGLNMLSRLLRPKPKMAVSSRRRIKGILFLAFMIMAVYEFVGGDYGLYRIRNQKLRIEHLKRELEGIQRENEALRKQAQLMENHLPTIEKIARERYRMIKPGEEVYLVYEGKPEDGREQTADEKVQGKESRESRVK